METSPTEVRNLNQFTIAPTPLSHWTWFWGIYLTVCYLGSWGLVAFGVYDLQHRPGTVPGTIRWDAIAGLAAYELLMTTAYLFFWWWYLPRFHATLTFSGCQIQFIGSKRQHHFNIEETEALYWQCGFWRRLLVLKLKDSTLKLNLSHYTEPAQLQMIRYFRDLTPLSRQSGWDLFSWKYAGSLLPKTDDSTTENISTFEKLKRMTSLPILILVMLIIQFLLMEKLAPISSIVFYLPFVLPAYWYSFQSVYQVYFFNGFSTRVMWFPLVLCWLPTHLSLLGFSQIDWQSGNDGMELYSQIINGYLIALVVMAVCWVPLRFYLNHLFDKQIRTMKQNWKNISPTYFVNPFCTHQSDMKPNN